MIPPRLPPHLLAILAAPVLLTGCVSLGLASKADILRQAEYAQTRSQLEDALGQPSRLSRLGPVETWTYDARDGAVVFLLINGRVALQSTGELLE